MIVVSSSYELKRVLKEKPNIGFVPTMGALHEGHLSLIKESKKECETTVVSIFVNPTQFLPGEDLDKYPRTFEEDKAKCEKEGADIIFFPSVNEIYGKDEVSVIAPKTEGFILEGLNRVGHFNGVLTVVLKLFNMVNPTKAFFGKKDAQQLFLIQKMVADLFLDVEIVPCEIVREADGLAMSSRNVYLNQEDRSEALKISKTLNFAKENYKNLDIKDLESEMREILQPLDVEYVEFRDRSFGLIEKVEEEKSLVLIAARAGKTRLIDNIWI